MAEAIRPVPGADGLFEPFGSMAMVEPGLYSTEGFEESTIPGLYEFSVLDPAFTLYLDGNPSVEIFFTNYAVGTVRVRLYRYSEGRTWLVRGGVDIATSVAVRDFEVPSGVTSTYRAEMFNAAGESLGFNEPASVTMPEFGPVVHQPLDPSLYAMVVNLLGTADTLSRPMPGELTYTEGATVGRRIGQRRRGLSGVNLEFMTETIADADMVQAMLGTYETEQVAVLCVRTPPPIRIPRTLFAASDTLEEVETDVHMGGTAVRYRMQVDEVEPPFPGLVKPLLTYSDLDASFPTYAARDANYDSYTTQDRDYSLAGAAG